MSNIIDFGASACKFSKCEHPVHSIHEPYYSVPKSALNFGGEEQVASYTLNIHTYCDNCGAKFENGEWVDDYPKELWRCNRKFVEEYFKNKDKNNNN